MTKHEKDWIASCTVILIVMLFFGWLNDAAKADLLNANCTRRRRRSNG